MFRFVAPAGAPLHISEILQSLDVTLFKKGTAEESLRPLADAVNARHIFVASSGRAALSLILRSMSRLRPGCTSVALPAYTCYTVPAAVVRAGLRMNPVEVDPLSLDFSPSHLERLDAEGLLCIVTSNLFGFMNDANRIRAVAQAHGAFIIDDAAQALGSTRGGCPAGMQGDVGIYSFGRGKALAAMEGGVIVTNSDDIAAAIAQELEGLPPASAVHSLWVLFQLLAYSVLLHPRAYWIPNSLPFLKLGTTEFDPGFPDFRLPRIVRELLPRLMERLAAMNQVRRSNAAMLRAGLKDHPDFAALQPGEDCVPNFIRFPLLARDAATRDRAVQRLRKAGIGASVLYPGAVCDIDGITPHMAVAGFHRPVAETIGRCLLTLPTHPFVSQQDLAGMIEVLSRF